MPELDTYIINVRNIKAAPLHRTFKLDDKFFNDLDQNEIKGGNAEAVLTLSHTMGSSYEATYTIRGTVTVACDRCLDDLTIPVDVEKTIVLKDEANDSPTPDDNTQYVENGCYDAAWELYELIELSLPIQRVHDIADCDPEVIKRLNLSDPEA